MMRLLQQFIIPSIVCLILGCQPFDYYKMKKFYWENKDNEQLKLFQNHFIFQPRVNMYEVDALILTINKTDTTIRIPGPLVITSLDTFINRANEYLEDDEKEKYLKIFREYKKLSVLSIFGGEDDCYINIQVITDYIYLYIIDHEKFNWGEYIKKWRPEKLKKLNNSWYIYYKPGW